LINWGRYGLGIYDTMTETTWHRKSVEHRLWERLGGLIAAHRKKGDSL
jgi:hypothetical protein